jgi:Flp pilus assembly protein TadD
MSVTPGNTPSMDVLLAQARNLRAAGRNHEAEASLRTLLAFRPDHGEALVGLGVLMRERGDLPGAIETLTRAVALLKRDPEAWAELGFAYALARRFDEARDALRKAVRAKPDFLEALAALAEIELGAGDAEQAVAAARRVTSLAPQFAAGFGLLGTAYARLGDLPQAEAAFRQWLAVAPRDPVALTNLANAVRQQGRFDEAESLYRGALAALPSYGPARLFLGGLLLETARPAEALPLLEQAAAETPTSAEPCMLLGAALEALGRDGEAESAYGEAVWRERGLEAGWCNLFELVKRRGDLNRMRVVVRDAIEALPRSPELRLMQSATLLGAGDIAGSIAAIEQALAAGIDSVRLRIALGSALRVANRLDEAAAVLSQALSLAPEDADALREKALIEEARRPLV